MAAEKQEFVTVRLGDQLLGIAVLDVQDVLNAQSITPVPLAPDWVAGVLNLRGRIVTAIDLRARLGLPERTDGARTNRMSVVIEQNDAPYSLLIDEIGEVLSLDEKRFEKNPVTFSAIWKEVAKGVYRLDDELMVVLDVDSVLSFAALDVAA